MTERKTASKKTTYQRRDLYAEVTGRILELLDQGTVPWKQPFRGTGGTGWPRSLTSGKPYRGINVFLLATTAMCHGYRSDYWLTFKQARKHGGQVRKGQKGSLVIFWKKLDAKRDDPGSRKKEVGEISSDELKERFVLRHYTVFNADQCDGIEPPDEQHDLPPPSDFERIAAADAIVQGWDDRPTIEHLGPRACYLPQSDRVQLPEPEGFTDGESYYATLFHELTHATGHSKRLDRGLDTHLRPFGSPDYSKEELIAEMGAAFLAAHAGIGVQTIEQSAAYIDGWRKQLNDDKKLVVQAAAHAQRAADLILGNTFDDQSNDDAANDEPAATRDEPVTPPPPSSFLPPNPAHDDQLVELKLQARKAKLSLKTCPPPPSNLYLATEGDLDQLRHYARRCQDWFNTHVEPWIEQGLLEDDPRAPWSQPQHGIDSDAGLTEAMQAFPLPGQANLNSTAPREQRSAYIGAVLDWWNQHHEPLKDLGLIDPAENPVVQVTDKQQEAAEREAHRRIQYHRMLLHLRGFPWLPPEPDDEDLQRFAEEARRWRDEHLDEWVELGVIEPASLPVERDGLHQEPAPEPEDDAVEGAVPEEDEEGQQEKKTASSGRELVVHAVDPARLEHGRWSEDFNRRVGEGDIAASYSGDLIAQKQKTRKPFVFQGEPWVAVSQGPGPQAKAYRLVLAECFNDAIVSYAERTADWDTTRPDPKGLYHGIHVDYRRETCVLAGPPHRFVPGAVATTQPGLFGDA